MNINCLFGTHPARIQKHKFRASIRWVASIAFATFVLAAGATSGFAQDDKAEEVSTERDLSIEVGDRVVVSANFDTKIFKEKVDKVYGGAIHTVIAIENEKWCALERVRGWLPLQYVMNLEMAEKQYTKRIEDNDQDAFAWAHRGMIRYENDYLISAFTDLNESLRINKNNPVTWNNRGIVLNAQGKYVLAMKDIRYAIKLNPKFADAYYNLGLVYHAMGDNKRSVDAYDAAIKLAPNNAWYYLSRGSAKRELDDLDGAMTDYDLAIEKNKRMADAYVGKSNVFLGRYDLEEAFKFADKAVEIQPRNAMALNARGWLNYKRGEYSSALRDFNRAIRYAPRLSIAFNNRGVCNAELQRYDDSIKDYNQAMKLQGDSPVTYSNRGTAYFGKGDYKKAKQDFEKALEIAPSLAEAANGMAWFLATCPDEAFRDGEVAVQEAKKACTISEDKDWNHIDTLAAALAETGDFAAAIECCEKALKAAPKEKKAIIEKRIALFEAKKPVRSEIGQVGKSN